MEITRISQKGEVTLRFTEPVLFPTNFTFSEENFLLSLNKLDKGKRSLQGIEEGNKAFSWLINSQSKSEVNLLLTFESAAYISNE